jgi:hypothetical protein
MIEELETIPTKIRYKGRVYVLEQEQPNPLRTVFMGEDLKNYTPFGEEVNECPYPENTAGWWIWNCKEEWRDKALKGKQTKNLHLYKICPSLKESIKRGFEWCSTDDGGDYWLKIHESL